MYCVVRWFDLLQKHYWLSTKQHCTFFHLQLKALTHRSMFFQRDVYLSTLNLIKSFLSFRADMSRDFTSFHFMLKLYRAFILPHFQYCFTVWHHCGACNAEKFEALNKRILILLKDYSSSYDQLLDKVNLNFLCLWVYTYVRKRWNNRGGSWKFHEQNVLPQNVNNIFLYKFK